MADFVKAGRDAQTESYPKPTRRIFVPTPLPPTPTPDPLSQPKLVIVLGHASCARLAEDLDRYGDCLINLSETLHAHADTFRELSLKPENITLGTVDGAPLQPHEEYWRLGSLYRHHANRAERSANVWFGCVRCRPGRNQAQAGILPGVPYPEPGGFLDGGDDGPPVAGDPALDPQAALGGVGVADLRAGGVGDVAVAMADAA